MVLEVAVAAGCEGESGGIRGSAREGARPRACRGRPAEAGRRTTSRPENGRFRSQRAGGWASAAELFIWSMGRQLEALDLPAHGSDDQLVYL